MHRDHGRSSRSNGRFERLRIHAVVCRIRVYKNGDSLRKQDSGGRSHPRIRGNDHFIARTQAACLQRDLQRDRPVGTGNTVTGALKGGKAFVENLSIRVGGGISAPIPPLQHEHQNFLFFFAEFRPAREWFGADRCPAPYRKFSHEPSLPLLRRSKHYRQRTTNAGSPTVWEDVGGLARARAPRLKLRSWIVYKCTRSRRLSTFTLIILLQEIT